MVTLEESIPQFSAGYKQARSTFYVQFNEVDFYIEDAWQENLYHCILSRLFPKLKIENIHPLCGKENAIEHSKTPILKLEYVRKELGFTALWDDMVKQLAQLFAVFFIVQKHNLPMKSTSFEPDVFCSKDDKRNIDGGRVASYIRNARKYMVNQNVGRDLDFELEACAGDFELKKPKHLRGAHVSGQFLLLLCSHRIAKQFGINSVPDMHSFGYRLAEKCEFKSLSEIRRKINDYLKLR